jgi:hypothetical protein
MIRETSSSIKLKKWLTILNSTRSIKLPIDPDFEPIVKHPNKSRKLFTRNKVKQLLRENGYCVGVNSLRKVRFKNFHFSTHKGPDGKPAIISLVKEYYSLPFGLKQAIKHLGGKYFQSLIKEFEVSTKYLGEEICENNYPIFRRLGFIPDLEGKTRVIAIADYFSQTVLKPLHNFLLGILKSFPNDITFNQGRFKDIVQD